MKVGVPSEACCADMSDVEKSERVVWADDLVCYLWVLGTLSFPGHARHLDRLPRSSSNVQTERSKLQILLQFGSSFPYMKRHKLTPLSSAPPP